MGGLDLPASCGESRSASRTRLNPTLRVLALEYHVDDASSRRCQSLMASVYASGQDPRPLVQVEHGSAATTRLALRG